MLKLVLIRSFAIFHGFRRPKNVWKWQVHSICQSRIISSMERSGLIHPDIVPLIVLLPVLDSNNFTLDSSTLENSDVVLKKQSNNSYWYLITTFYRDKKNSSFIETKKGLIKTNLCSSYLYEILACTDKIFLFWVKGICLLIMYGRFYFQTFLFQERYNPKLSNFKNNTTLINVIKCIGKI